VRKDLSRPFIHISHLRLIHHTVHFRMSIPYVVTCNAKYKALKKQEMTIFAQQKNLGYAAVQFSRRTERRRSADWYDPFLLRPARLKSGQAT
jgi:hypothetical protein